MSDELLQQIEELSCDAIDSESNAKDMRNVLFHIAGLCRGYRIASKQMVKVVTK